jgi:hypothetical protein
MGLDTYLGVAHCCALVIPANSMAALTDQIAWLRT